MIEDETFGEVVAARAHPSWAACDLLVRFGEGPWAGTVRKSVPKHPAAATTTFDLRAAADMAAQVGVGPLVLDEDDGGGIIMERLAKSRPLTLSRLHDETLTRVLDTHERIMTSGARLRSRRVIDEIADLERVMKVTGTVRRADGADVYDALPAIAAAVAHGPEPVPAWGDGNLGNVFIDSSGDIALTGGAHAGAMDPLQQIGALLSELIPFVGTDPANLLGATWARLDGQQRARAELYAIAHDLAFAYRAWAYDRILGTNGVEYATFGSLRLRRALRAVRSDRFTTALADAA